MDSPPRSGPIRAPSRPLSLSSSLTRPVRSTASPWSARVLRTTPGLVRHPVDLATAQPRGGPGAALDATSPFTSYSSAPGSSCGSPPGGRRDAAPCRLHLRRSPARLRHPGDLPPGEGEHFGVKADATGSRTPRVISLCCLRCRSMPPVRCASRSVRPGSYRQAVIVTLACGSRPERPDVSGVNGLTRGLTTPRPAIAPLA